MVNSSYVLTGTTYVGNLDTFPDSFDQLGKLTFSSVNAAIAFCSGLTYLFDGSIRPKVKTLSVLWHDEW